MDFTEFSKTITKCLEKKQSKVRNSYGVYDCYKYIRKNKWLDIGRALKEHEFYSIIRGVNNYLAKEIALGNSVTFPHRMGKLELRKVSKGVSIVDGKLKNTYPINWPETILLWYNDEEERKKKTLLRLENNTIFHIKYSKYEANYENKHFYEFNVNRGIKRSLKENVNKGIIETLW